ncbi:MAG: hypothetical protein Q7U38_02290 [Methylobacter sp.]|nr:hypothetical protein [Methylobacter sp.]MDP2100003.1 hypothetical protein [Methylobacter sp.]MDP2427551.1 hypothetical protein [Methylobacter sp.]MDP3054519.1 hypothetical protein [Methylobacter sp.]MDP3362623.1 hypothetical protein [Methylobacter sp.]
MKRQLFELAALLLCCQSLLAEPAPVQNETLKDPTAMTEKLEQGLAGVLLPIDNSDVPVSGNSATENELKDPTRMNQNFREALKQVPTTNGAPSGAATPPPTLPNIQLVASVCGMHKDKNYAMLRINDKTVMVSIDDKVTTIQNNQLMEIHVLDIDKRHVKVEILPANEIIILQ